jgi:large subunit ribosomal protein L19
MALTIVHDKQSFSIGDIVRVHQKITEAEKTRIQVFEGMVIAIRGEGKNKTFTVRRIGAGGVGVERIFPLYSPLLEKVEVVKHGRVRRSKLYYLREKTAHEIAEITKGHNRSKNTTKSPKQSKLKSGLRDSKITISN